DQTVLSILSVIKCASDLGDKLCVWLFGFYKSPVKDLFCAMLINPPDLCGHNHLLSYNLASENCLLPLKMPCHVVFNPIINPFNTFWVGVAISVGTFQPVSRLVCGEWKIQWATRSYELCLHFPK